MKVSHVSFDVWNTLVRSNPQYVAMRDASLVDIFGLDVAVVRKVYQRIKQWVDVTAELTGNQATTTTQLHFLLGRELCRAASSSTSPLNLLRDVTGAITSAFEQHPPIVLPCMRMIVDELHNMGITVSIGSNSNFLTGDLMYGMLQREFDHSFAFGVFSDLAMVAKPSSVFFDAIHQQSPCVHRESILHIGDNHLCDVDGAAWAGMQSAWIAPQEQDPPAIFATILRNLNHD